METRNSLSAADHAELSRKPDRPSRLLRWANGGVHWISGAVLLYAFISNGETTRAMINPVAMRGEVQLGMVVGFIFLIRLIWVRSRHTLGGQWAAPSLQFPKSTIRSLTYSGIYLGVAATVVSGLLIAYFRPGAEIIPGNRHFLTRSLALNASIHTHVKVVTALEWLCAFHVVYFVWFWKIRKTRWGKILEGWLDRVASIADRWGVMRLVGRTVNVAQ